MVYGATGSQGSPVARQLLEKGARVRVVTRSPKKAAGLEEAGAEIFEGDMGDEESLRTASEGVDAVSLLVPFFVESPEDGIRYGKNAVDAAREAGVEVLVWNTSGIIPPERTGNPGFDLRLDILEHLQQSGLPHVVLQPTAYMENFLGPWTAPEVAEQDTFAYPTPNEVGMQWVATEDVAAFQVEAIRNPSAADANFEVCGPERLHGKEIAERFGAALGRDISFRPMPPEEFGGIIDQAFPGMGESAARGYRMAYKDPEAFSTNIDVDPVLHELPVRLTSLEEWVRSNRMAFEKQEVSI